MKLAHAFEGHSDLSSAPKGFCSSLAGKLSDSLASTWKYIPPVVYGGAAAAFSLGAIYAQPDDRVILQTAAAAFFFFKAIQSLPTSYFSRIENTFPHAVSIFPVSKSKHQIALEFLATAFRSHQSTIPTIAFDTPSEKLQWREISEGYQSMNQQIRLVHDILPPLNTNLLKAVEEIEQAVIPSQYIGRVSDYVVQTTHSSSNTTLNTIEQHSQTTANLIGRLEQTTIVHNTILQSQQLSNRVTTQAQQQKSETATLKKQLTKCQNQIKKLPALKRRNTELHELNKRLKKDNANYCLQVGELLDRVSTRAMKKRKLRDQ